MDGMAMTFELDNADLRELQTRIFPQLLASGRRSLEEQCVTSSVFIARRAQQATKFADIGRIDEDLETVDHVSKSKTPGLSGLHWTVGMMIAVMRTDPNSPYSLSTGNRWPLPKPTGKRGSVENWRYFVNAADRQQAGRHSSTHFLQTGWTPGIMKGLASPLFRYNASFGSRAAARALPNERARAFEGKDVSALGDMVIELSGDDCMVTTSNDVGGDGNEVLAAKHRAALIEFGTGPLEGAVAQEVTDGENELARRLQAKADKIV